MANAFPPDLDRAGAVNRLDRWLTGTLGATRLPPREGFPERWRIGAAVSGKPINLVIGLSHEYPRALPRVAVIDAPPFGTWPHVERDGTVCVTSSAERFDRDQPVAVARGLLGRVLEVLRQGIEGENEDDFRSEFLSYWDVLAGRRAVQSIIDPSGPSRRVVTWGGDRFRVIAEAPSELRPWLSNLRGRRVTDDACRGAALLWLDRPMLPREYPNDVAGLMTIASRAEGDGEAILNRLFQSSTDQHLVVLIGADGPDGATFGAVELVPRSIDRARNRRGLSGKSAADRLSLWKSADLSRTRVERADTNWIHGRDSNPDLLDLRIAKVALVGCGSLGSQVARQLALAGVGELRLIDPERMEWANVGRHVLGAPGKGRLKAEALAAQLRAEFPASRFEAHESRWQEAAVALDGCDLVVSTIGSLDDEADLTKWQRGHPGLPIVFGWTEPRGCASQAVAIGKGAGCLLCGFDQLGDPRFRATDWIETPLRRQAACGSWFMPYGAGEITSAAILASELALDVLTGRAGSGVHRVQSCREGILRTAGGEWTPAWRAAAGPGDPAGRVIELSWLPAIDCPACRGAGPA